MSDLPVEQKAKPPAKKKKMTTKDFIEAYQEMEPELLKANVELQRTALNVIKSNIASVSAVQAATIYGILADKMHNAVKTQPQDSNTFNMYIGDNMSTDGISDLMSKVMSRMNNKKIDEAEIVDVESHSESEIIKKIDQK